MNPCAAERQKRNPDAGNQQEREKNQAIVFDPAPPSHIAHSYSAKNTSSNVSPRQGVMAYVTTSCCGRSDEANNRGQREIKLLFDSEGRSSGEKPSKCVKPCNQKFCKKMK